jgi:hypothetical protein
MTTQGVSAHVRLVENVMRTDIHVMNDVHGILSGLSRQSLCGAPFW